MMEMMSRKLTPYPIKSFKDAISITYDLSIKPQKSPSSFPTKGFTLLRLPVFLIRGYQCSSVVNELYTFSAISQTPQGQMPAQNPQPMHLLSSTTYSKDLFGSVFRLIAP